MIMIAVSNVLQKSIRVKRVNFHLSDAWRMCSLTFNSAVVVLCLDLNPDS